MSTKIKWSSTDVMIFSEGRRFDERPYIRLKVLGTFFIWKHHKRIERRTPPPPPLPVGLVRFRKRGYLTLISSLCKGGLMTEK